jgi:hypothetical protein
MSTNRTRSIAAALVLSLSSVSLVSAQAQQSVGVPDSLSKLKPVELSALVLDAMPTIDSTTLGWDQMLSAPIQWITDGVKTTEIGAEIREGKARVRVHGRVSTVLKQTEEELPWTIEMDSTINEKFGPQEITIQPGNLDGGQCFGSLYSNCTFTPNEAFTSTMFKAQFLCQVNEDVGAGYVRYYRLTAPGRVDLIAAYNHDEGSGGITTGIALTLASNRDPSGFSHTRPDCAGVSSSPLQPVVNPTFASPAAI